MRQSEIEKKIKSLPVKRMREDFRTRLLSKLESNLKPAGFPSDPLINLMPVLNIAVFVLIVILVVILYLPSTTHVADNIPAGNQNQIIIEVGRELYSGEGIALIASITRTGQPGFISMKEVSL